MQVALRELMDVLVDSQKRCLEAVAAEFGDGLLDLGFVRIEYVAERVIEELCGQSLEVRG
jgi:hypothetical protein